MNRKILVVNNHSKNKDKLIRLASSQGSVDSIDCDCFSPEKAGEYDLVILSGGSHVCAADHTKKAYEAEIDFLKNTSKPVIGICLGCQLIAKAFGGSLKKLNEGMRGIGEIKLENGSKFSVFESHKYAIDTLPNCIDILASSEACPEIIKHKEKQIIGFQFHPEVYPRKTDGQKLFYKYIEHLDV